MPLVPLPNSPARILIIKPSSIGDIVHALPVLNLVRRRWPDAHIAWLVASAFAGLLEGHPQLDEVIRFDRRGYASGWTNPSQAVGFWRFLFDLRRRKFDLVIDLQGLLRSGLLAFQSGAPVRVGPANARELGWMFYTHRVPVPSMDVHAVDRSLLLAESLDCGSSPVEFHFAVDDTDRSRVTDLLAPLSSPTPSPAEQNPKFRIPNPEFQSAIGNRQSAISPTPFAVLMPGTNWPTKRWPADHFAALVKPLRDRFGLSTVLAGGADAAALAPHISADLDLTGKTDLRTLVALLERASLVIANDSGPMHIAAALGRPLVTPYGPTNPARTGPYNRPDTVLRLDIPCSPCYSRTCSHTSCLRLLPPDPVLRLAEKQLLNGGKTIVAI